MESEKLPIRLIEAIWSENKDTACINHQEKILEILESTDIICIPKMYNAIRMSHKANYVFVPTKLKPNHEGVHILNASIDKCNGKSPTLCFVFTDKFMPPAIFTRVQAACIEEFKILEISGKCMLFHQTAIFQLNKTFDFHLEQFKHTIRVSVVSDSEENINTHLCKSMLTFLEEKLDEITEIYHGFEKTSDVPFYKAIQCEIAEGKLYALIPWEDLVASAKYRCKGHDHSTLNFEHHYTIKDR